MRLPRWKCRKNDKKGEILRWVVVCSRPRGRAIMAKRRRRKSILLSFNMNDFSRNSPTDEGQGLIASRSFIYHFLRNLFVISRCSLDFWYIVWFLRYLEKLRALSPVWELNQSTFFEFCEQTTKQISFKFSKSMKSYRTNKMSHSSNLIRLKARKIWARFFWLFEQTTGPILIKILEMIEFDVPNKKLEGLAR